MNYVICITSRYMVRWWLLWHARIFTDYHRNEVFLLVKCIWWSFGLGLT